MTEDGGVRVSFPPQGGQGYIGRINGKIMAPFSIIYDIFQHLSRKGDKCCIRKEVMNDRKQFLHP
jgi:hypothetical protein